MPRANAGFTRAAGKLDDKLMIVTWIISGSYKGSGIGVQNIPAVYSCLH